MQKRVVGLLNKCQN